MTDPRFGDRAVYLPAADAVVLADLHVGRDRASNVQLPVGERGDLTDRLAGVLAEFDPAEVVIAGDLLHTFDAIPSGVQGTLDDLLGVIDDAGADPVVVRGNHDSMLDSVYGGPIRDEYRLADDTVVCHGHERPTADADRYVVGHDHPAIEIEGQRHPCFLLGSGVYEGTDVVMVPAFTALAAGTPVGGATGDDLLSPLVRNVGRFRPVVRDADAGETLQFPPLDRFREML